MFSLDQLVSLPTDAPLADEVVCEKLAKAAMDYAFEALGVAEDRAPSTRQSHFLAVIEDSIIHHIDCGLRTNATVGDLKQDLKSFIDQLAEIFNSTRPELLDGANPVVH